MAYTKTTWVDEVLAGAERFDVADNVGTPIHTAVQIALATAVTVAGTPINAANLNKIEQALEDAHADKFVTLPKMDDMAMGVIGRQTNTTGVLSRIFTTVNDRVLMRRADELVFQTINADNIAADAVTTAKILDAQVTDAKLAAGAVIAGKIATGGVSAAAQLADGIVTQDKLANGASKLTNRQGGSATDWNEQGTTNYVPSTARMQAGVKNWSGTAANSGSLTITFPQAFSSNPIGFANAVAATADISVGVLSTYTTNMTIYWKTVSGGNITSMNFSWLAIGP